MVVRVFTADGRVVQVGRTTCASDGSWCLRLPEDCQGIRAIAVNGD
jgi:hypothetical protein